MEARLVPYMNLNSWTVKVFLNLHSPELPVCPTHCFGSCSELVNSQPRSVQHFKGNLRISRLSTKVCPTFKRVSRNKQTLYQSLSNISKGISELANSLPSSVQHFKGNLRISRLSTKVCPTFKRVSRNKQTLYQSLSNISKGISELANSLPSSVQHFKGNLRISKLSTKVFPTYQRESQN